MTTSDASWSTKLREIGEIERPDHYYLEPEHACAYFGEYTARKGWKHSAANGIINNLKKPPDRRGMPEWAHKERAIADVGRLIRANLKPTANLTIVPAPPSKALCDPAYDDRIVRIAAAIGGVDVRSLLSTDQSREPAHLTDNRPGPDVLAQGLRFSEQEMAKGRVGSQIVLLDDVLVTGATFVACRRVLLERFPNASIFGLFVARRVPERSLSFDDFDL